MDSSFFTQLSKDMAIINSLEEDLRDGAYTQEEFNEKMKDTSPAAQTFALSMQETGQTVEQFALQQKQAQVAMIASDKSISNTLAILKEYNAGCTTCGLTQTEFAEGAGQSNSILGDYLSSLNGGQASLGGYIKSLVASKAATIGFQAATMAMNMALSYGISLLVSAAFSMISEPIRLQKKDGIQAAFLSLFAAVFAMRTIGKLIFIVFNVVPVIIIPDSSFNRLFR